MSDEVREFLRLPGGPLDAVLDLKLKSPEMTGKILSYAASYLRERMPAYENRLSKSDIAMLERVMHICTAGSEHLSHLAPPEEKKPVFEEEALSDG